MRVLEDGVECWEREDGTGERAWEEDLPPGAVRVPGERWVRVLEGGVECWEREDGTGERAWEEDLPPGAVRVR